MLVKRLKKVISISIKYIIQTLKESNFEIYGTEMEFGNSESSKYLPIELKLDNGKKVKITGKIDRVDIAKMPDGRYIRIIDYKSSTKDIDLNKVISGLQLQLLTYVDAICENESKQKLEEEVQNNIMKPAGALYFALTDPKSIVKNREDANDETIEKRIKEHFKMKGLILADINIIKAMDANLESGKSDKIPVTLNTSGEINYSKSSTVTREEFEKLQKFATHIIKKISNEILEGNIELRPYYSVKEKRTPCSYCEYKSICQFNPKFKNNSYRFVPNKPKQEILDELTKG